MSQPAISTIFIYQEKKNVNCELSYLTLYALTKTIIVSYILPRKSECVHTYLVPATIKLTVFQSTVELLTQLYFLYSTNIIIPHYWNLVWHFATVLTTTTQVLVPIYGCV